MALLLGLRFPDDILLFARTAAEAMALLDDLVHKLENIGLHLNTGKTVVLTSEVHVKSKPGRRVAGPFWAQAVNQKRQYLQIRIYKSLHFRPCRSCRKSQKVPTMFFCPVRIPSNARVVCSDRRL